MKYFTKQSESYFCPFIPLQNLLNSTTQSLFSHVQSNFHLFCMAPTFILVSLVYSKLCIDFTHVTTPLQQIKSLPFLISQLVHFSMAYYSFSQKILITMLKPRHLSSYYSCVPGHIMSSKIEGFICGYFCFSLICFPNCLRLLFSSTPQSRESSFIKYSYIKLYTSSFILDQ